MPARRGAGCAAPASSPMRAASRDPDRIPAARGAWPRPHRHLPMARRECSPCDPRQSLRRPQPARCAEHKAPIVCESFWPGNRVGDVAQRDALNRRQFSAWRTQTRRGKIDAGQPGLRVILPTFREGNAMAQRRLSMRKIRQALRLHYDAGLGVRAVARSLKASPSTVRERPQRQQVGSPVSALDKQRKTLLNH